MGWMQSVAGLGIGVGLSFLVDPVSGRRRRALARDRFVHWAHQTRDAWGRSVRDLEHRAAGTVAETRAILRPGTVPNALLVERVRARVGRVVRHSRDLTVTAEDGCITLAGQVAPFEHERVLRAASRVPGVRSVRDALVLGHFDEVPPPERPLPQRLPPAGKLLAGVVGLAGLALLGARQLRH